MNKILPLLIVFGIVFFIGCTTEDVTNSISSGGNYVELSSIISNPEAYVGKEITVKGTITSNFNYHNLGGGLIISEPLNGFDAGTDQWGNKLYVSFVKDPQDNHHPLAPQVWEATGIFQRFDVCGEWGVSGCENKIGLYYFLNLTGHPLKLISSPW
jgi:hypothetical protein